LTEAKARARKCYAKAGFRVASSTAAAGWGAKKQHAWSEWQKLRKAPAWSCCPHKIDKKISSLELCKRHISSLFICFLLGSVADSR